MTKKTVSSDNQGNTQGNNLPEKGPNDNKFRDRLGRFLAGHAGTLKQFQTREQLAAAVISFFEECEQNKEHPTMAGLALHLGFSSRMSLVNYNKESGYEEHWEVVNYARLQIEAYLERRLPDLKSNVAGLIFNLKNNFNWVDKQEIKMDQRSITLTGFTMNRNEENNGSSNQSN